MCELFSPKILHAGAVMGLSYSRCSHVVSRFTVNRSSGVNCRRGPQHCGGISELRSNSNNKDFLYSTFP